MICWTVLTGNTDRAPGWSAGESLEYAGPDVPEVGMKGSSRSFLTGKSGIVTLKVRNSGEGEDASG